MAVAIKKIESVVSIICRMTVIQIFISSTLRLLEVEIPSIITSTCLLLKYSMRDSRVHLLDDELTDESEVLVVVGVGWSCWTSR